MERAERVLDRTEKKVEKSVGRGKVVKDRRANWEDLNEKVGSGKAGRKAKRRAKTDEIEEVEMETESGVVIGNGETVDAPTALEKGPKLVVVDRTATAEPEDEIT